VNDIQNSIVVSTGATRRLIHEINSISAHLEDLCRLWAQQLGVSGPQWKLLMALADADEGGIPIHIVSKSLCVEPSFVTTQSKLLENRGLIHRRPSPRDARIVQLSLTDTMHCLIAKATRQEVLDEFIFSELDEEQLNELMSRLSSLKKRVAKACIKLTLEL
jgi:MarR family transcriptional regulator, organic hydroperoxide resistance regulator